MNAKTSRRGFLKGVIAAGAAPMIVPARVLGADAPSNKLQIAIIGLGRVGTSMDIGGLAANQDHAMLTTICDVDSVRNPHKSHHRVWFEGMRERKDTHITVEEANVSTISCILGYHAMNNIGRTIGWDPVKHVFTNPDDQKKLYSCFERPQFAVAPIIREIRKKAGA